MASERDSIQAEKAAMARHRQGYDNDSARIARNASETKIGPPMKVKHRDNEPTHGGQEHSDWNAPTKPNMWPGGSIYSGRIGHGDWTPEDQKIDPSAPRVKPVPNAKPRGGSPNYV